MQTELTCVQVAPPEPVTGAPRLYQWSRRAEPDRVEVLGRGPSLDGAEQALHLGVVEVDGRWAPTATEWVVAPAIGLAVLAGDRAVWVEGEAARELVVADVDGGPPVRVSLDGDVVGLAAAASPSGTSVFVAGPAGLEHLGVGADGEVSDRSWLGGATYMVPQAVSLSDGAAVVWVDDALRCRFATVDDAGGVQLGPWTTSEPGEACAGPVVTEVPGGFLVAQSRFVGGTVQQELVRVGGGGPAAPVALTGPVADDVSQDRPSFVPLEDRVGLFWSEGVVAVGGICAGCIPDHQVRYVVLDPGGLLPVSEPVTLAWTASSAGLFGARATPGPQGLHVTFEVTVHAGWSPGHATLGCD